MLSDNLRHLRAVFAEHRHGALTISGSFVEVIVENLDRAIDDARALEHAQAPALVRAAACGDPKVVQLFSRAASTRGNPFAPSTPHTPDMAYTPDPERPPCA